MSTPLDLEAFLSQLSALQSQQTEVSGLHTDLATVQSQLSAVQSELSLIKGERALPHGSRPSDVQWKLITSAFVFLMQLGFAMIESGSESPLAPTQNSIRAARYPPGC